MPLYDYHCRDCGAEFEVLQRIDGPTPDCRACGAPTERVLRKAPALHLAAAAGREEAVRSLPSCGKGCRCCP